jgi:rhodanese-related sulfurtransferase
MANNQDNLENFRENVSEGVQNAADKVKEGMHGMSENMQGVKDKLKDDYHNSGDKVADAISTIKEKLPNVTPTPPGLKAQSSASDLKSRLEWGEPGFTILDVRDRDTYNQGHIMGAMPMPMDELVDRATPAINYNRDIYVYADSDEQTAQAANMLRDAGFYNVAELKGGLSGWKAVGGPTEGALEALTPPNAGDYNVVARLATEKKVRQQ